jgi:adenosyl cobinamide kinase/adenosyl cobinamide phosphate guanylyltransferase
MTLLSHAFRLTAANRRHIERLKPNWIESTTMFRRALPRLSRMNEPVLLLCISTLVDEMMMDGTSIGIDHSECREIGFTFEREFDTSAILHPSIAIEAPHCLHV